MFEDLDKTRIPTSLLLDYAVNLVNLSNFDGTALTDSNYVNVTTFADILKSIRSAAVQRASFPDITAIMNNFSTSLSSNTINIAFALYKYNYIRADALDNNLITYNTSTEKVSDVFQNGVWKNPYAEANLFAFSPNVNISSSNNVTFNFSENNIFKNQNYSNLYFDPGDGGGYRVVNETSSLTVRYGSIGLKELKLKLQTMTGVILEAHSNIFVSDLENILTKSGEVSNLPSFEKYKTYQGINVGARATWHSTSLDKKIRKPFIIVEGFDPLELVNLMYDTSGNKDILIGATSYYSIEDSLCISQIWKNLIFHMKYRHIFLMTHLI